MTQRLDHPGIVKIYSYEVVRSDLFIVMELCGENLDDYSNRLFDERGDWKAKFWTNKKLLSQMLKDFR